MSIERGTKGLGLLGVSPPDYRDLMHVAPMRDLPPAIDLRQERNAKGIRCMPAIFDQDVLGSCTANASNRVAQYVETRDGDPDRDRLSRLWTYYWSRHKIGTVLEDSGAFIRDSFAVHAELGVPREAFWPYDIDAFATEPALGEHVHSPSHHRAVEYRAVPVSEQAMAACLAEGYPFAFGFAVYESFWSIGQDGRWDGTRGNIDGWHAVTAVGYDFTAGGLGFPDGGWIVDNSWGTEHGAGGSYFVPRRYMEAEAVDVWTIRKVTR